MISTTFSQSSAQRPKCATSCATVPGACLVQTGPRFRCLSIDTSECLRYRSTAETYIKCKPTRPNSRAPSLVPSREWAGDSLAPEARGTPYHFGEASDMCLVQPLPCRAGGLRAAAAEPRTLGALDRR